MRVYLVIIILFIVKNSQAASYCIPNPSNGVNGHSITHVHFESIDTSFTGIPYQFLRDSLYNETCYLTPGVQYKIYMKSGTHNTSTLAAWIDWNNDTTLSVLEKLGEFVTTNNGQTDSITFTVPSNCYKGKLRLRLRASNSSSINACSNYSSGETIDFTVTTLDPFYEHNFTLGWEFSGTGNYYISGVGIGTINNQNSGGVKGPFYGDYSYMITNLTACDSSYSLILTGNFSSNNDTVYAFIDYNNNGYFENNELIGKRSFPAGVNTYSILFNSPSITGTVKLRIIYYSNSVMKEVEDYSLLFLSSSVSALPNAMIGTDLFYDCTSGCYYYGCKGQHTFHDISCGHPSVHSWSVPGASPSTSTSVNPTFNFPNSGIYTITLINSNSFGADTATTQIYISPPVVSINLGNDTTLCTGSTMQLAAPAGGPGDCFTYLWSTGQTSRTIFVHSPGTFSVNLYSCKHSDCPSYDEITVSYSPNAYNVTGGGNNCTGSTTGFNVGLSNSQVGIDYQLYYSGNPTGSPVPGTGNALSFGLQTQAGTYTVTATNSSIACTSNMSGSAVISIGLPPVAVNVTGGGSYCSGGSGLPVGLDSSINNVNYQLFVNGNSIGAPINGNGGVITFPNHTNAGSYTVVATDQSSFCTASMTGSASIAILPGPAVHNVSGGGNMCGGVPAASVVLNNSDTGVTYVLFRNGNSTGDTITGTGTSISYQQLLISGSYTIVASDTTSCTSTMNGVATFNFEPTPTPFVLSGGGIFCSGDSIGDITLSNSEAGVRYQLYLDSNYVGNSLNGNGGPLNFGNQTAPGTYYVIGSNTITACHLPMSGTPTLVIHPIPFVFGVTGGGHYCMGGPGVDVGLNSSDTSVLYLLYRDSIPAGSPVYGVQHAMSFGLQTLPGTYTVIAIGSTPTCFDTMSNSATVVVDSLPSVNIFSGLPDTICFYFSPVALSGNPPGGLFSGNGVINDTLFPGFSGVGLVHISYDYTDTSTGCSASAFDSIMVDICNGSEEFDLSSAISLYPNPANSELIISLPPLRSEMMTMDLINNVGQFVKSFRTNTVNFSSKYVIRVSDLREGVYLLKCSFDKNVFLKKVLIVHGY